VTPLEEPRFEGSVRLRDDRRLGFAEYGPVTGRPLLWFHGTPGARRQIAPEARTLAHEHGVRIVCVERPGIGESTPHAYAALIDFADDIKQLCAALEIDRFAVAGLSGGGPYALACAHAMPERVVVVTVLGGVVPVVGPDAARGGANELIRAFSPLLERSWRPLGGVMQRLVRALERWADPATDLFARFMPPGDQAVFAEPATRRMFQEDMFIGSREQMHAIWLDARLFGREWGFDLRDVRVPAFLRYGDADIIVPLAHGEHLAKRLPDAELRVYSGEGHLGSLGASREIFEFVLERWE
jgi:pimeloyl-ACP methyl ester carboxylesterase